MYTRNTQYDIVGRNNEQLQIYIHITPPNNKQPNEKGIGGTAIMIKNEWGNNILHTPMYSRRCMKIALQTGVRNKNLHIINTYAPHMGYSR